MTDEAELRAVTIGDLTPYATKVVIEDYNPAWPSWFAADRALILSALGDAVLSVEHTGSTSVPGLPAKPIIDILLQVPDSADESSYVPQLEAVGFALRIREPEGMEHRVLYRRGEPHDVNVHVYSPIHAAPEITRILAFRNWLRTHDDDRDRYAATKRELSKKDWKFVQNYADAKTEIIEEILAKTV
jgi:GrpB-like predicted nucleotidyltransferase (UPF0157 family)